jgi:hypothetical protein
MNEQWRLTRRLAGIGLAVTIILYAAYAIVPPYSADPPRAMKLLGLVSALLCPPSLMLVSPLTIYEPPYAVGGPGLWLIVVLVNSVFYAVIGAPCLGLRKKSDGAATS